MQRSSLAILLLFTVQFLPQSTGYSVLQDPRFIAEFEREQKLRDGPTNHAKVARSLVHEADWAAVGSISTDSKIVGYPMVNMVSIADSAKNGKSTGHIYFLLTDLDFTSKDWKQSNKISFFFSEEQLLNCSKRGVDPMEPTCARAIISGQVQQLNGNDPEYATAYAEFFSRHPQPPLNSLKVDGFYLCKLNIEHIYVLDSYGGPNDVPVELYYETDPSI